MRNQPGRASDIPLIKFIKYRYQIYLMQISIRLQHRNIRKDFVVSTKTKPHTLRKLAKKALHLTNQIKYLKSQDGSKTTIQQIIEQARSGNYDVVLDDESSEEKPKSQVCSQRAMSRVSGRKNPPSENELLDSKFYVDDFQFFMSEVSGQKENRLFGIVFFNSKKKASFLGKKILRQLIFQFDKIQFFYALHPIKMHTSSALLGDLLMFTLFRGKNMIHQRQFPQQITAADQILSYIQNLTKTGLLDFNKQTKEHKKPKNLIKVQEQRSFDHKLQSSPQKLSDFGGKPSRTAELIKTKSVSPNIESKKIFQNIPPQESPIRSQITNQISFENDLYQPQWFFQGDALNRLQKSILSSLIKSGDQTLSTFLNGLSLKNKQSEKLNIKLVRVFLREFIDDKFSKFSAQQLKFVQDNQQNRKSYVYTGLLKLHKFGNITQFIENTHKKISIQLSKQKLESPPQFKFMQMKKIESELVQDTKDQLRQQAKQIKLQEATVPGDFNIRKQSQFSAGTNNSKDIQYSMIAKNTDKNKMGFSIKLLNCGNDHQQSSPSSELSSPFRLNQQKKTQHTQIANLFHREQLSPVNRQLFKNIQFGKDYDQPQKAGILDLINKHDAFIMQSFLPKHQGAKKGEKLSSKIVKKYLRQVQSRFDQIRQRTVIDDELHIKITKLQVFNGLLYYLYKLRLINKKQLKIAFYLYTWSDLNVLGAFELYLLDRNIQELVDTLYAIDYNYYLHEVYQIDHAQVQQFTVEIQKQLIILFLYEGFIASGEARISLQKFIRAGDLSLLNLYRSQDLTDKQFIGKMIELSHIKKQELDYIKQGQNIAQVESRQKKKARCNFLDQLILARFRDFKKKQILFECINLEEPTITHMLEALDKSGQNLQFIQSFGTYLADIDAKHCHVTLKEVIKGGQLSWQKVANCKPQLLKGIYQAYLVTKDVQDTIDSLDRAIKRYEREGK